MDERRKRNAHRVAAAMAVALAGAVACRSGDDRNGPPPPRIPVAEPAAGQAPEDAGGGEAGTAEVAEADPPPRGRRVVLVVVDTLRADRLGCYGYREQPTSPAIDRVASEGIVFERFHAAAPWTGASFGSILTGVAPTVHRGGKRLPRTSERGESFLGLRVTRLREDVRTLAEMLGEITSAAIVTNAFLHPSFGFDRGFDHYDHRIARITRSRRADQVTDAAVKWLRSHGDAPFFLLVHYFDPHIAYDPPVRYRRRFAPGPSGRFSAPFLEHSKARKGELEPTDDERRFISGLYDGEVRFVDDQLGRLLKAMKRGRMLDDTWIAITADHGEEIFDHGSFDHGHRYEEEVTRVPLVVRAPGGRWRAGTRVPFSSRHVDLVPTILDWFGLAAAPGLDGSSLMPLISGAESKHRPAYMEYNIYWRSRRALFDGRYKLIREVESDRGFLYDLERDPKETRRLGADHPRYAELDAQLAAVVRLLEQKTGAGGRADREVDIDEGTRKALEELGYLAVEEDPKDPLD